MKLFDALRSIISITPRLSVGQLVVIDVAVPAGIVDTDDLDMEGTFAVITAIDKLPDGDVVYTLSNGFTFSIDELRIPTDHEAAEGFRKFLYK